MVMVAIVTVAAFAGGFAFRSVIGWAGTDYFVIANRQMIMTAVAAAEDREPQQCLKLLNDYTEKASKLPQAIGYVHANLLEFERAIGKLEKTQADSHGEKGAQAP